MTTTDLPQMRASIDSSRKATTSLPSRSVIAIKLDIECFVSLLQKIAFRRKASSGRVDDFRSFWRGGLFAGRTRLASLIEDSTKLSIIGARSAEPPKEEAQTAV